MPEIAIRERNSSLKLRGLLKGKRTAREENFTGESPVATAHIKQILSFIIKAHRHEDQKTL